MCLHASLGRSRGPRTYQKRKGLISHLVCRSVSNPHGVFSRPAVRPVARLSRKAPPNSPRNYPIWLNLAPTNLFFNPISREMANGKWQNQRSCFPAAVRPRLPLHTHPLLPFGHPQLPRIHLIPFGYGVSSLLQLARHSAYSLRVPVPVLSQRLIPR
ncbi:uncharacterized protein BO72DRAFT_16528 [Aspergillus fijiensis CBS 313.89]|uniref:Uncharacterized protein n=1 Tax=Aspergillus fijiensis CBS 313.89 TaxID=1448319 RepID=A0A8G1VTT5_9EURO|nr:uncharacterized protein BO72DRAFT_16528 [Aspergillus fijiensis CBS 313.89]RAK71373.1 hypothetical protein BO72DRAFT_16528 [Aspergillus fijiensis CBS 313.89]